VIYKSIEDEDKNKIYSVTKYGYVCTLFEFGAYWIWRSSAVNRLVITQDGYVVYLKSHIGPSDNLNLHEAFPDTNIDDYIKNNPDKVLVRKCSKLADNILDLALCIDKHKHISRPDYRGIRPSLVRIPQIMGFEGCDGGFISASFCDDNIRTRGRSFQLRCHHIARSGVKNFDKLNKAFIVDSLEDSTIISYLVLADTLINITKAVMITDIKEDQIPEGRTVDDIKNEICVRLLGREMLDEQDVKEYISNPTSGKTYYDWIPPYKGLYYPD
jgi:hypothetical protein